jgi:hypothetical protein
MTLAGALEADLAAAGALAAPAGLAAWAKQKEGNASTAAIKSTHPSDSHCSRVEWPKGKDLRRTATCEVIGP